MLVLRKSRLLLPLLLLLPHNNRGMDGCQGKYGQNRWKCGDVCTYIEAQCTCGNSTFKQGDGKWCCSTNCTGGNCLRWKEGGSPWDCLERSPAICTTGVALNLTESCGSKYKCNENQQDAHRNLYSSRSHLAACADNRTCVKEGEGATAGNWDGMGLTSGYKPTICTGDSSCEGELAWCKKEERKNENCLEIGQSGGVEFTRCLPTLVGGKKKKDDSQTKWIPGQCIEREKRQDGIYHCIDRTDENPFQEAGKGTKHKKIDFKKLKTCTTEDYGRLGLQCSGSEKSNCITMYDWCNDRESEECPVLGLGILTNNLEICKEYKFWQDKPCYDENYIRCRAGHSGQCVKKEHWGVEGAKDPWGGDVPTCEDGSDQYRPIVKGEEPGRQPSGPYNNEHSGDGEYSDDEDYDENNVVKGEESGRQPSQQQVWKTEPESEEDYNWKYKGKEEGANYTKDDTTGLWMIPESDPFKVPSITEEDFEKGPAEFYSNDNYVKDNMTNLMMAPTTEETCKANNGFVCKVRLDAGDLTSMIMMMTIGMMIPGWWLDSIE